MKFVANLAFLLAALLSATAFAQTATIDVNAPPDRLALPGAFVTLVYVVTSPVAGEAQVEVTSQHGYTLLAPPPTASLKAGVATPVAATVEIPADAPALTVDAVTLTVTLGGVRGEGTVHVTIGAKRGLAIEAPSTVPVSAGEVTFTLVNQGNVEEKATFRVTLNGTKVHRAPHNARTGCAPTCDRGSVRAWIVRGRPGGGRQDACPGLHSRRSGRGPIPAADSPARRPERLDRRQPDMGLLGQAAGITLGLPDDHRRTLRR